MRKRVIICFALILCLLFCGCANAAPDAGEASLLEYPGTHWGDSPETVMESLSLTEKEAERKESDGNCYIGISGGTYFEAASEGIIFRFEPDSSGAYGLTRVEIYYSDETDLSPVSAALEAQYGPKADVFSTLMRDINGEGKTEYSMKTEAPTDEILGLWTSAPLSSRFGDKDRRTAERFFCQDSKEPMPKDIFDEFWTKEPMVTITCTNDAYPQFRALPEGTFRKAVIFSATQLHYIQKICTAGSNG